jgi:hypothetical protein
MAKAPLRVLESFVGSLNGVEVEYHSGELVDADDPAVAKWPHLFAELQVTHRRSVEQATAAPGEQRAAPAGKALTKASLKGK